MNHRRSASRAASFRHAIAGIGNMLRTQPNAWVHSAITIAVIALALWLGLGRLEWAIVWLAIGLVWCTEFVNSAVEAAVDLASPEVRPLAKIGKDVAAAAVLIAAGTAAAAGLCILGPPLWNRLFGS